MLKKIVMIFVVLLLFTLWFFTPWKVDDTPPTSQNLHETFEAPQQNSINLVKKHDSIALTNQVTPFSEQPIKTQGSVINTMASLIDYLDNAQLHTLNMSLLIDFINHDNQAFTYLQTQYFESTSARQKALLLQVIEASTHVNKNDFALELIHSVMPNERQSAINLLNKADNIDVAQVNSLLIEAFHTEENNEVLATLLSSIDFPEAEQEPQSFDFVISRLSTLVFDAPEHIAALALVNLARLQPNDETLAILTTQMKSIGENTDDEIQLAAIKGLYNYKTLSVEVIEHLQSIKDTLEIQGYSKPKINDAIINLLNVYGEENDADEDPNQDN